MYEYKVPILNIFNGIFIQNLKIYDLTKCKSKVVCPEHMIHKVMAYPEKL